MDDLDTMWCAVISLTLKAMLEDGGEVWQCNVCGGMVHIPAEMAIATPASWYLHKRPPTQIPQMIRDAFQSEEQ